MIVGPLIAIDPSLNSMGWAYWNEKRLRSVEPLVPSAVGLLHAPRGGELAARSLWLCDALSRELNLTAEGARYNFVCEYPAYHGSPLGWQTGDLQKLTFLVGVFAGYFKHARTFVPVTPNTWKGQMSKAVVIRRLTKRFGPGATREWQKDEWDAVGIGLWRLGRF
jgi:hypothetical protein